MPTTRGSIPRRRVPLSAEALLRRVERRAEAAQETADGADVKASAATAAVGDLADGTTPFTGLNVAGDDKVGFLAKVEASALADPAGLADGLVTTGKVGVNAITDQASAETSASQTLTGTTAKQIQTVTYVSTGETIEVRANFFMTVWHPSAGDISANVVIERDGLGEIFNQLIVAIGGDYIQGWQTPTVIDAPAAGSVTYRVKVTLTNNGADTQTVQGALLSVREFKR